MLCFDSAALTVLLFVARCGVSDPDTQELFEAIDTDGDGNLSPSELLHAFRTLGESDVTEAEVAQVFALLDEDGDGTIDYAEVSRVGRLNMELKSLSNKVATMDATINSVRQQLDRQEHTSPLKAAGGGANTSTVRYVASWHAKLYSLRAFTQSLGSLPPQEE